jgi:hypothetical protein
MSNNQNLLSQSNSFELTLGNDHINKKWLNVKASFRLLFPKDNNTSIILVIDKGDISAVFKTYDSRGSPWLERGDLHFWFDEHKELRAGNKVLITVIKPQTKYRLEIVK